MLITNILFMKLIFFKQFEKNINKTFLKYHIKIIYSAVRFESQFFFFLNHTSNYIN